LKLWRRQKKNRYPDEERTARILKPNFQQLLNALASLASHVDALTRAGNNPPQISVDKLTASVADCDNKVVAVLIAPPPTPPTGKLDFAAFDKAVSAFKADGKLSQQDVANVSALLTRNTP
jgi:hypothetical protein